MATITHKCPRCNGALVFEPSSGRFVCPYCDASYDESDIASFEVYESKDAPAFPEDRGLDTDFNASLYTCPSCGAEIIADDTTAASDCVYCHQPVALTRRLSGDYRPDRIIPFAIPKEEVMAFFNKWIAKKKFMRKDFFSDQSFELLRGVYFPFWCVDGSMHASVTASAKQVHSWTDARYRYTETKSYDVRRSGNFKYDDIALKAITKDEQSDLLNGLNPFGFKKAIPFKMPYLSGFYADKRNLEAEDVKPQVEKIASDTLSSRMKGTMPYTEVKITSSVTANKHEVWEYVLVPVWMISTVYEGKRYYFALNGETGSVAGRVPMSKGKVFGTSAAIFAAVSAIMCLGGYLFI